MSSNASKLPGRFAITGLAVGVGLPVLSWFFMNYNVFHLPTTLKQEQQLGSYSEPAMLSFFQGAAIVLCPGLLLEFFAMDLGLWGQLVVWAVATSINGVLSYWLGRGIVAFMRRFRR